MVASLADTDTDASAEPNSHLHKDLWRCPFRATNTPLPSKTDHFNNFSGETHA